MSAIMQINTKNNKQTFSYPDKFTVNDTYGCTSESPPASPIIPASSSECQNKLQKIGQACESVTNSRAISIPNKSCDHVCTQNDHMHIYQVSRDQSQQCNSRLARHQSHSLPLGSLLVSTFLVQHQHLLTEFKPNNTLCLLR